MAVPSLLGLGAEDTVPRAQTASARFTFTHCRASLGPGAWGRLGTPQISFVPHSAEEAGPTKATAHD